MQAEFVPKHLEKAVDLARHIATFGRLEFSPSYIRMRIVDPAKIVHFDMIVTPGIMKCDRDFSFGINLQMFYKLLKSLNNDESIEIEADESVMKISQCTHYHHLINQDVPSILSIINFEGPKINVNTKTFQKYLRALANIAPAIEVHYVPASDTLFLESVNSMYRTLFAVDTGMTPYEGEEYRKTFMAKFLEMAINPSLADTIDIIMGDSLVIEYKNDISVVVTVAAYTEG